MAERAEAGRRSNAGSATVTERPHSGCLGAEAVVWRTAVYLMSAGLFAWATFR